MREQIIESVEAKGPLSVSVDIWQVGVQSDCYWNSGRLLTSPPVKLRSRVQRTGSEKLDSSPRCLVRELIRAYWDY